MNVWVLLVAVFSVFHLYEQWDGGQCSGVGAGHPDNLFAAVLDFPRLSPRLALGRLRGRVSSVPNGA